MGPRRADAGEGDLRRPEERRRALRRGISEEQAEGAEAAARRGIFEGRRLLHASRSGQKSWQHVQSQIAQWPPSGLQQKRFLLVFFLKNRHESSKILSIVE